MKNKLLIEDYVNALVIGDSSFLWKHNDFNKKITEAEEIAYLKNLLMEHLDEMSTNSQKQFEKNEQRFNDFLKENNLDKVFS
ncbi:MAG: hypothetical protein JWN78_983 [Bacteroidota bacterium]|nr:hypothetical protein [Bacteroidota bacterium]